ncbi:hypothetical protein [Poriferisphaera sp. WC338]|uniref:hypothetical protein n=1 Tax=Poriferisphaera sp. WC338 TaxID=3425129 RepID=UPI003D818A0C
MPEETFPQTNIPTTRSIASRFIAATILFILVAPLCFFVIALPALAIFSWQSIPFGGAISLNVHAVAIFIAITIGALAAVRQFTRT